MFTKRPTLLNLKKKEEFESLPKSLTLREIHYYICLPGFRTNQVTVITTLLDSQTYSVFQIAELYGIRWDVELDLRHIKTTLGMDLLRSKTPEMVRKEIYVYLLAYNLLRTVMWSAGSIGEVNPLRLSLQATRHHLDNFIPEFKKAPSKKRENLSRTLLKLVKNEKLKKRPGRVCVRAIKRRPKSDLCLSALPY